jgi:hypothetical protein
MKRLIVFVAGFVFVFSAYIFAADGPSTAPAKTEPSKAVTMKPPKETRVSITGIVKEISDTTIVVERTVKGKTEIMEFALDKPVVKIKAGDKVRVSYIKKEDKYIARRVTPFIAKKIIKKTSPLKEIKPLPTEAQPAQK